MTDTYSNTDSRAANLHLGGDAWAHPALERLLMDAESVTVHPDNPRRGDLDTITESLRVNGLYRALVVQTSTSYLLAGNHTYLALKQLGAKKVPVTSLDVDDHEAARIVLADNRTSDLGAYDMPALVEMLNELDAEAFLGTGYSEADLEQLLVDLDASGEVSKNAAGYYEARGEATDPNAEWVGMPDYDNADLRPVRQLVVSFAAHEDVAAFAELLGQTITEKARSIWYPEQPIDSVRDIHYVSDE